MVDIALQRKNMVESQVRPSDVTDRRVIRAMEAVPREVFVPASMKPVAYMDEEVPLEAAPGTPRGSRALLAPRTFAKLLQAAEFGDRDIVLDVGCATGYSSAIIARIAQTVVALEQDDRLAAEATRNIAQLSLDNIAVVTGPLSRGHAAEGPYDAIVIEGAVAGVPPVLLDQLKDGGRLVAILGPRSGGRATVWRRTGATFATHPVFDAAGPLLPGFEPARAFVF